MKEIQIKKVNEILSLKHESVGSITHHISLKEGRCTFYADAYMRETCKPTLNVAATYEEVEKLRDVFTTILTLMQEGMSQEKRATKVKHPSGKRGFLITTSNGKEISVLDFSSVMKTAPKEVKKCVYLGWEAWDGEECMRGETYQEVEDKLKKKYTLHF